MQWSNYSASGGTVTTLSLIDFTAFRFARLPMWTYRMVVLISACPKSSFTVTMSLPQAISRVANVCRKVCHVSRVSRHLSQPLQARVFEVIHSDLVIEQIRAGFDSPPLHDDLAGHIRQWKLQFLLGLANNDFELIFPCVVPVNFFL